MIILRYLVADFRATGTLQEGGRPQYKYIGLLPALFIIFVFVFLFFPRRRQTVRPQ